MKLWPLLAVTAPLLLGAGSDSPALIQPIACKLGQNCVIQHFVDDDPGPAVKDFRCGTRSYADHSGIDFRIQSMDALRRGVAVLAAADGKVLRIRDGVEDVSVREVGAAAIKNINCGNGVVIQHAGGLETQYCHMAKGSVSVKADQLVKAGMPIGRVGLSGATEFPHLHFTVRSNGTVVDPFAAGAPTGRCGGGRSLWAPQTGLAKAYKPADLINAGFATGPVTPALALVHGSQQQPQPTREAPALVAFAQAVGLKAGDVQRLMVTGPDGTVIADNRVQPLDRDKADWVVFAGRKRPATGWATGQYQARYTLLRAGNAVIERSFAIRL